MGRGEWERVGKNNKNFDPEINKKKKKKWEEKNKNSQRIRKGLRVESERGKEKKFYLIKLWFSTLKEWKSKVGRAGKEIENRR